jgi:hypothetical protein
VSVATKRRIAESVLADLPLERALNILPRLRFPRGVEHELTHKLAEKAIDYVHSVECFWRAVHIRLSTPLPAHERLAVALRGLTVDPIKTVKDISAFGLTSPDLQVPFARKCVQRSGVDTIFTLPWLASLGTSDPAGAMEIAALCIANHPFDTAPSIEKFGLPLSPLIELLLKEVGAKYHWKVIAKVCGLPSLPEPVRFALFQDFFERVPYETLAHLELFKLPEGETVTNILKQGLALHPKAVATYVQRNASPHFREIAESTLWSRVSDMPWEAADVAVRVGVKDQGLLSAIAQETFSRDPARSLRFIRESTMFAQETLCELALAFSVIDVLSLSRHVKRFGPLPDTTLRKIGYRLAAVDAERALGLLETTAFSDEEHRRELLISMATSPKGAAVAARNIRRGAFTNPQNKLVLLERCIELDTTATIESLGLAGLTEPMHAELIAHATLGHEKNARKLLTQVGVYSQQVLTGLFSPRVIDSLDASRPLGGLDAARRLAKSTPAKVAANIYSYKLPLERDRVEIAIACAKRAPRAVAEHFLAFGIYSNAGRRAVAAALHRNSASGLEEAIKTCGITAEEEIQELLVPLASVRPRILSTLKHLTKEPWPTQFFTRLFAQAMREERWSHAFEISKVAAESLLGREPRQSESLKSYDSLLAQLKTLPHLDEQHFYQISLLERVRRAGTIPENSVLRAFTLFDESSDAFVVEVLQQGGPSSGANIVEEMTRIYGKNGTIPDTDRAIIREFISSGFRGFSKTTLAAAKKEFAKSSDDGRRLLASWKDISTAILQGNPLPKDLEESPFYPNLIYAAYRPVDLRVASVKEMLPTIPDNSHHLAPWKYPADGYPLQLVEMDEVRLKPNEAIDRDALRSIAAHIHGVSVEQNGCSHDEFVQILVKASQRGIDSINKGKLVTFLATQSQDIRVQGTIRELSRLLVEEMSPPQAAEAIEKMKTFYNVVYGDMLDVVLRSYFDGGRLDLREQFKSRIRNILKLPSEADLSIEQIRETVRGELDKVWRLERTGLNRESRKFTSQIGTMHSEYRIYLSKTPSSFFGRAGAGLCTHDDMWSWDQENFLQMIMVDERRGAVIGNIQLHIFEAPDGNRAVLARLNPTEKFLLSANKKALATEMLGCVETFARENNLTPYLPGNGDHLHLLTNRESFSPLLEARYGERFKFDIKVSSWLNVEEIYRLMPRHTSPQVPS